VIRRQKDLIENQKIEVDSAYNLLEIKSEEIQDSIIYAKRIQVGILPSDELIKSTFKESFIFYQPKDIVAGDFYWIDNSMEDNILFAVGDCTGHGVPGAMVSILCQSILNRVIVENDLIEPSKILDKTRVLLIENLKGGEIIKDGMDISLCSYNKKTKSMQFSGANHSLWIIRSDELIEIKGDHQPVGEFERANLFVNNEVKLVNNDIIYLFSDGYVDQFGGEAGKKYKKTRFKNLLLSVCKESLSKQREIISQRFESWKGNQEQVDDVLILGVKI
jgi:serine phosphatase RsbU (regulator of sigma subunit)